MVFKKGEPHPFLGRELSQDRDYSEHAARVIDQEVRKITLAMEERAAGILEENRVLLEALATALLEHETLAREDIDDIVKGADGRGAADDGSRGRKT